MKSEGLVACIVSSCLVAAVATPFNSPAIAAESYNRDEQVRINVYQQASSAVVTLETSTGAGSGSIIDPGGLVLTNEHVVRGARGGRVTAIASNRRRYPGQVIAVDRRNDLALVQLQVREPLPALEIADSNAIRIGQEVYAIGSPFGLSGTFTTGILSRIADNGDLQTDAAINPGNSGGPLLNSQGQLIGVNKAILSPGGRGNIGIGFATSANAARAFVAQSQNAIASGARPNPSGTRPNPLPERGQPRLGVEIASNLVVQSIERGSLAHRLGLRPGDRIVAINRRRLRNVRQLLAFLETQPEAMLLTVARNRRLTTVEVQF
ncbi:MAG: trypsin-like peptidase domain-containing protein [Cyanobacteriota bacterium]|nr:trypsin-like peptidase domain-containing protein [Cyanobacteriota bacterium]